MTANAGHEPSAETTGSAEAVGSSAEPVDSLRVLTMNVLAPEYADGAGRRAALARVVRELAPDVLALQEVTHAETAALRAAGWHVVAHPHWSGLPPQGVGAVLAARRPFGRVVQDPLRVTERVAAMTPWCGVVVAELPLPEPLGGVLVVHHKPSWPYGFERERELQAVAAARCVADVVRRVPVRHAILLGDFDAPPDAASVRFWRGVQSLEGVSVCYQDAWTSRGARDADDAGAARPTAGHTFTPENPLVRRGDMPEEAGRRIDYVMVGCGPHGPTLRVTRCARVGTVPEPVSGLHLSDHYGVLADVTVPDHEPGRWA
ncbi:endonuclease/exonuclease/phosphatase family protein [Streptomyces odontomachi]|uniref:endonuclease/exonuclease/phosphatase family protein n=1 Tax=Streptomyces odontomachi TaxID=2944940 RepID=UPI00210C2726|nr:endonuclease/exonuclease/phosphatase family protein [Streptomyces sp. ODS25]